MQRPRAMPTMYLTASIKNPLAKGSPIFFTSMVAPEQNINIPTAVAAPELAKRPVVKLPICSASGKKVFMVQPIKSGITCIPAGNFRIVSTICMSKPPFIFGSGSFWATPAGLFAKAAGGKGAVPAGVNADCPAERRCGNRILCLFRRFAGLAGPGFSAALPARRSATKTVVDRKVVLI